MDNPLEQPAPDDVIDRAHAYARDLAYGVAQGWWGIEDITQISSNSMRTLRFFTKYRDGKPEYRLLEVLGYIAADRGIYILTQKALALLEKPIKPPSVFISYRHKESSSLALYIEARLKKADIEVSIDKDLPLGEEWDLKLQERVKNCEYFVCLIGANTHKSVNVLKEIDWAKQNNRTIIPIFHTRSNKNMLELLQSRQGIPVKGDRALDYEFAITQLLNRLGYSTY